MVEAVWRLKMSRRREDALGVLPLPSAPLQLQVPELRRTQGSRVYQACFGQGMVALATYTCVEQAGTIYDERWHGAARPNPTCCDMLRSACAFDTGLSLRVGECYVICATSPLQSLFRRARLLAWEPNTPMFNMLVAL